MANRLPIKAADVHARAFALLRTCWPTLLLASYISGIVTDLFDHAATRTHPVLSVIGLILSTTLMVGLYQGLLEAWRGGNCSPRTLLAGFGQFGRVLMLEGVLLLRTVGWGLLAVLPPAILGVIVSEVTGVDALDTMIPAMIALMVMAVWLMVRYSFAAVHLADVKSRAGTASDCIRASVADVRAIGFWRTLWVQWPVVLTFGLMYGLMYGLAYVIPAPSGVWLVLIRLILMAAPCFTQALIISLYTAIPRAE